MSKLGTYRNWCFSEHKLPIRNCYHPDHSETLSADIRLIKKVLLDLVPVTGNKKLSDPWTSIHRQATLITLSTANCRRMRARSSLKTGHYYFCHFSHDCVKYSQWSDFWIRHWYVTTDKGPTGAGTAGLVFVYPIFKFTHFTLSLSRGDGSAWPQNGWPIR